MAVTANGWPQLDRLTGARFVAVGEGKAHDVVSVDLAVIAASFVYDFHTRVEPVESCFGARTVAQQRETNPLAEDSNHCSGTAWDLNGAQHPYEAAQPGPWRSGFNAAQVNTIRALLAYYEVLQWGGDFTSPYRDAMHWQIRQANLGGNGPRVVSEADVARVARKVASFWTRVQRTVGAKADGLAGPGTIAAVKTWQAAHGLVPDGIWGPFSTAVAGWNVKVQIAHGVDVSNHQSVKDWQAVAPDLLVAKATEGLSYVDPSYTEHATAAREAGIFRGAYHFVWLGFDPATCCQHFLSTAQLADGERGIIDFEPYSDEQAGGVPEKDWPAWVVAFIEEYRRQRGEHPDIYLNDDMAARLMKQADKDQAKLIRSCGLWKARYDSDPGDSHGWPGIVGWQYSGEVIDRNVFYDSPAKTHKKAKPKGPHLHVDGVFGEKSVAALMDAAGVKGKPFLSSQARSQRRNLYGITAIHYAHGTPRGSQTVAWLQGVVGSPVDGILGPQTIRDLQGWLRRHGFPKTPVDGIWGNGLSKRVQRALNRNILR